MKIKAYIFAVMILAMLAVPQVRAESSPSSEFQVKAAFLFNFLMFIDWPAEKMGDNSRPMIIGLIGDDQFGNAFDPVKDKMVNNRKVIIKRFKKLEEIKKLDKAAQDKEIEAIRGCHLLFICDSEEKILKEIFDLVKDNNVLTVADIPGFLESGGMINFLVEEGKIRFEINDTVASQTKLNIRSQLLRLAKRVIGEKSAKEAKH